MVQAECVHVAGIHSYRTFVVVVVIVFVVVVFFAMECVQSLALGLCSHPKEF